MIKVGSEQIIALRNQGKTVPEIAKELGCAKSTVSYHLKINGLGQENRYVSKELKVEMQSYYDEGHTCQEVADKFKYNIGTILRFVTTREVIGQTQEERLVSVKNNVINWRKDKKAKLVDYKGGCCQRCGYNKNIKALQFHHRNPKEKDFQISGTSLSYEKLLKEVDKCDLLCANCHIEVHDELLATEIS
jgi:IS30 family transposase